jgi:protein-tyrosine-phosphatase
MAEALLNKLDPEHFEATSAGIDRGVMHPSTLDAMRAIGVDLGGRATKTVRDVLSLDFDFVITLCDRARFECPRLVGAELVHWQFEDPLAESDLTKQTRMFQSLRDQIAHRVRLFALVQVRFAAAETHLTERPRLSALYHV